MASARDRLRSLDTDVQAFDSFGTESTPSLLPRKMLADLKSGQFVLRSCEASIVVSAPTMRAMDATPALHAVGIHASVREWSNAGKRITFVEPNGPLFIEWSNL